MAASDTPKRILVAILVVAVPMAGVAGALGPGASAHATQDCSFPFEGTDATGTTVTIDERPDSIVTAAPSAAQTLVEIGAWDRVVGVSEFASYLDGFEDREVVSAEGEVGLNVEKIVSLDPDLVVVPQGFLTEDAEKLREAGVTVFVFDEAGSVEDVKSQTRLMGRLVGACDGAEETVDWMESELATVREAVAGQEPVEAMYVYSPDFGPYTSGANTFVGDAIETAGAVNLAAEADIEGHKQVSDEVVAAQDPEWLVVNDVDGQPPRNDVYNSTTAVQEGNVVVVNSNHLNQPAPRIVHAIKKMAKAFHPEAYAEAQATPTETPASTDTPTAMEMSAGTDTPTPAAEEDEGSPGFGPVVALVAVLAVALAASRRD